jgi:hypothetical protein
MFSVPARTENPEPKNQELWNPGTLEPGQLT